MIAHHKSWDINCRNNFKCLLCSDGERFKRPQLTRMNADSAAKHADTRTTMLGSQVTATDKNVSKLLSRHTSQKQNYLPTCLCCKHIKLITLCVLWCGLSLGGFSLLTLFDSTELLLARYNPQNTSFK